MGQKPETENKGLKIGNWNRFYCDNCPKYFSNPTDIAMHVAKYHDDRPADESKKRRCA